METKMFFLLFLLVFLAICGKLSAIGELENFRALSDELTNPATLPFAEDRQIGLVVFNRYQMSELNTAQLYVQIPNSFLDAGAKVWTFGYSDYRLTQLQTHFAKKLRRNLSIGVLLNYQHKSSILEEQAQQQLSAGVGIEWLVNDKIALALLGEKDGLNGGVKYLASEKATLYTEIASEKTHPLQFSVLLDYAVHPQIHVRSGYSSANNLPSFGVVYQWDQWSLDAGFALHATLGMNSQIGAHYAF